MAQKGAAGGSRDGGFLFVLRPDGSLKFATDNGFGFFELVTVATDAADGTWHHVTGVRQGAGLTVYLDGITLPGTTGGTATPPLDIDNGQTLTIGATEQTQEPYRFLTGRAGAVTLWRVARSAAQVARDLRTTARTDSGLAGYWTFDHRTGADSSPYHNTAAAVGSVGYVAPGAPLTGGDHAARLGATGTFTAPANDAYDIGADDFTVEAWIRTAAPGGAGTIISRKGTAGGSRDGGFLFVLRPDGSLKFATDNGFGYFQGVTGATDASDGRWHHAAGVRHGGVVRIYLDGLVVTSTSSGNAPPPLNVDNGLSLMIGSVEQSEEPYRHFDGDLAAVTLWRVARDTSAIWSDAHTALTGAETGLVGCWPFTYRNGLDLSPTANNATAAGSAAYVSPGAPVGWFAAVLADQGHLSVPSNAAYQLGTGDFTVEAWVRTAAPGGAGTIVARKGSAGGPGGGGFLFVLRPDGSLKFATDNGFGFHLVDTVPTVAGDGGWHFVAGVRRSVELSVYVDGQPVDGEMTGTEPPPLNVDSGQPLTIGTTGQEAEPYRLLTGQVDAVALFRGARPPETVAADMRTRFTGEEAGLLGFWGFDFRDGRDTSPTRADAAPSGNVTFAPPGAPIGQAITMAPALTEVADDGQRVTATWTAVSQPPVTGYRLTLFDGTGTPAASADGPATGGSVPAPPPGEHTVRVRAVGRDTLGPWSEPVPVVTTAPTRPTVAVTDTAVTATWSAVAQATGYRLDLVSAGATVASVDVTATEGQLPFPADRGPAYSVRVHGQVGSPPLSTGPWSEETPALLTAPVVREVGYDGQRVRVAWGALGPPVDGYLVAILVDGTEAATAGTSDTTAELAVSTRPGVGYVVRVRALAGDSQGAWSAPVTVVTTVPSGLLAGAIGDQVAARWHDDGPPGYQAALSVDGVWGEPRSVTSPTITFAGDIVAGAVHEVRVRLVDGISDGPWSVSVPGPFLRSGAVAYDGVGRLTGIEFTGVATTTYRYDAAGNITEVAVAEVAS